MFGVSKLNEKNTSIFTKNSEEKLGLGSGVILTSNGYILSNLETTGNIGETCFVTLKNGENYPATVKWVNENLDVSIIKISAENLLNISLGDSSKVSIGEELYLLSNSAGIESNENLKDILVSKPNSSFKIFQDNKTIYCEDVIQINSKIDYENNGGAVVNKKGELLGIASNKIDSVIPVNRIKNVLEGLNQDENYKEPFLGIYGFDNNYIKCSVKDYPLKIGIYVDYVDEKSGLSGKAEVGDIITKIDDYELSSFQELENYISLKSPKDRATLNVIRGKKEFSIPVILK